MNGTWQRRGWGQQQVSLERGSAHFLGEGLVRNPDWPRAAEIGRTASATATSRTRLASAASFPRPGTLALVAAQLGMAAGGAGGKGEGLGVKALVARSALLMVVGMITLMGIVMVRVGLRPRARVMLMVMLMVMVETSSGLTFHHAHHAHQGLGIHHHHHNGHHNGHHHRYGGGADGADVGLGLRPPGSWSWSRSLVVVHSEGGAAQGGPTNTGPTAEPTAKTTAESKAMAVRSTVSPVDPVSAVGDRSLESLLDGLFDDPSSTQAVNDLPKPTLIAYIKVLQHIPTLVLL